MAWNALSKVNWLPPRTVKPVGRFRPDREERASLYDVLLRDGNDKSSAIPSSEPISIKMAHPPEVRRPGLASFHSRKSKAESSPSQPPSGRAGRTLSRRASGRRSILAGFQSREELDVEDPVK